MKKIFIFVMALLSTQAYARYDAFVSEVRTGLDRVSVKARGLSPEGQLGKAVYPAKGENLDIFIPTTFYVRMGLAANPGFASTGIDGQDYKLGIGPKIGVGWNMFSFVRGEMSWSNTDFRFEDFNVGMDVLRTTVYFDTMERNVMFGDVMYRRKVIPFFGIGGSAGVFGKSDAVYGGHIESGLNFVISDRNSVDVAITYEHLFSGADGFGGAGASISWRVGF